ncbi:unnamed protein product [Urochloa decumbens]|uniref:non-specific serine/threonine protein kinase n=1 Tax=Urochloa decumbens TaxID=240449 RepID=A0ABC9D293_9POAL
MARLLSFILVFLSFDSVAILAAESMNKSEVDRQALLSFKASIPSDTLSVLRSWSNESLDFCSWRGVTCGKDLPLRVVSLELNSLHLSGPLSPSLANLTSVTQLDLGSNSFSGEIPKELGTLPKLQNLMLASNMLAGEIPGSLGTGRSLSYVNLAYNTLSGGIPHSLATSSSLTVLNLTMNGLSGTIPASLFNGSSQLVVVDLRGNLLSGPIPNFHRMATLQVLSLAENNLSGSIPTSLGNVSSLTEISLHTNNLGGPIPETLSRIPNLIVLRLGENNLSGSTPTELFNISSLRFIDLGQNSLIGRIPSNVGNSLPNLKVLTMWGNRINGSIPESLANASKLQLVDLSNNSLAGPVPSLGSLPELYGLILGNNNLESDDWTFLASLTNCSHLEFLAMDGNILNGSLPRLLVGNLSASLEYLNFENNQIVGPIPLEVGNLASLENLNFGNNQIVGPIPLEVGKLASLISLKLGQNRLVGTITTVVQNLSNLQMLDINQNLLSGGIPSTIAKLRQLVILNLSKNSLSGPIPSTIGNLSMLTELHMYNNNLSANIPSSLGNCRQLIMLDLSSNRLYGSIPSQLLTGSLQFVSLDLSRNNLTGSIPPQIGGLIGLIYLDISYNNLSGEALSSLGQCASLQYLNTKRNMLNGSIPQSFSATSISSMDLSQNNFTGQIPEFLGNLSQLIELDLSNNNFFGPIPTGGIFQNTSAVILDGNIRLCTANATPFSSIFPICPRISAGGRMKNARLFAIVIPPITIALFSFLCFVTTLLKKRAHTAPCYKETMKKVSYGDILKATNWLSPVNKISSSHTGSVYIGRFEFDTDLVAIKVFHLNEYGSLNTFLMECEVLKNTRHRNLMKAVTVCSAVDLENNEFKAIVFDFMANGSLDMWVHPKLHENCLKRVLSLDERIRIAVDVASALDYMHNQLAPPLIHCDLKPANVLLDYDMTARVGDFGSAKFLSSSLSSPKDIAGLGGTIGYIAPEYGMGYKISTGCDVYSFGVLLLEMLTGMRPTDEMFTDGMSLHKLVSLAYPHGLCEVLDPYLSHGGDHVFATLTLQSYLIPLVEVALLCSMELPKDRPAMRDVCAKIVEIRESFLVS